MNTKRIKHLEIQHEDKGIFRADEYEVFQSGSTFLGECVLLKKSTFKKLLKEIDDLQSRPATQTDLNP